MVVRGSVSGPCPDAVTGGPGIVLSRGHLMENPDYDTRFRCRICGVWYVVPTLAIQCADRHRGEAAKDSRTPHE